MFNEHQFTCNGQPNTDCEAIQETERPSYALLDNISDILDVSLDYLAGKTELPLERRVRRELENMGLTKAQEDACVEIALNAIPVIKRIC